METASEAFDLSSLHVPKPKGGKETIEGGARLLLGLIGTCSWVRDSPRNANKIEESVAMNAID